MITEETKKTMAVEAVERMKLLKISEKEIADFEAGTVPKIRVNHEAGEIHMAKLTDEELAMVAKVEEEYDLMVYYVIQDEGIWPDGCKFPRYTFATVESDPKEYTYVKEECIGFCGVLPGYVVNMEEPDCSELTEFAFQSVVGSVINVS